HDPERRARDERRPAEVEPARVDGMDAVDVLLRCDRLDHAVLVDVVGRRKLDEQAVHAVVRVELGNRLEQLVLRQVGRQLEVARVHTGLGRRLLLQIDVDVRRRVVADQNGGEPYASELGDGSGHLLAHLRAERLAVDEGGGHRSEVTPVGARATKDCASGSCAKRGSTRLRTMPRLPRKNDPASTLARQQALGLPEVDVERYAKAAESVTGLVSIPVSVAQLPVSLGEYELSAEGEVVETGRADEEVVVPLAHTEGGLTASVQRGAKAIAESGGARTYVIADRITRASCFICKSSGDALALARWIESEVVAMREFLREADSPE